MPYSGYGNRTTATRPPQGKGASRGDIWGPRGINDGVDRPPPPPGAGWDDILGDKTSGELYGEASDRYKKAQFGYDPYLQDRAGLYEAQDFDPYRAASQNEAARQTQEQRQGAYNQLVMSGPVSAADRMQLASDFNRQKISGAFAGAQGANQRENQSQTQTAQQNVARGMDVSQANTAAQNQMLRTKGIAEEARRLNLYMTDRERKQLERKLKAAGKVAAAGGKGGGGTLLDALMGSLEDLFAFKF